MLVRRMTIIAENGMLGAGNVLKISINSLLSAFFLLVRIRFLSNEVTAVGLLQFSGLNIFLWDSISSSLMLGSFWCLVSLPLTVTG